MLHDDAEFVITLDASGGGGGLTEGTTVLSLASTLVAAVTVALM